jgi:hypothetical protein
MTGFYATEDCLSWVAWPECISKHLVKFLGESDA